MCGTGGEGWLLDKLPNLKYFVNYDAVSPAEGKLRIW